MLHAQQKWPEAITANLCPYALRHVNYDYNTTPLLAHPQGLSPLCTFTGTQVQDNPNNFHAFGCPTYFLGDPL